MELTDQPLDQWEDIQRGQGDAMFSCKDLENNRKRQLSSSPFTYQSDETRQGTTVMVRFDVKTVRPMPFSTLPTRIV